MGPLDRVPPFSPARRYTFQQKHLQNPTKNHTLQGQPFCCCDIFLCFSSQDSHDFPLKRRCIFIGSYKTLFISSGKPCTWKSASSPVRLGSYQVYKNCHYFLRKTHIVEDESCYHQDDSCEINKSIIIS